MNVNNKSVESWLAIKTQWAKLITKCDITFCIHFCKQSFFFHIILINQNYWLGNSDNFLWNKSFKVKVTWILLTKMTRFCSMFAHCVQLISWSMKSSLVNDIDKVFRACLRPFIAAWNLIASHWELVYQQLKNGWTYKKNPPYCAVRREKFPLWS